MDNRKVLLYSGGTDSWLIDKIWKPDVRLYIDTGGTYSKEEKERLPSNVEIVSFPLGQFEYGQTRYVPLRNLYFLMIASNYGERLCLGATSGDYGLVDKRPEFLQASEDIINYCLQEQTGWPGAKVQVEQRFVHMSKFDIMKEYLDAGGNIEEAIEKTFSCFNPQDGRPCFGCKPCFRKFMLGYYFGYQYTKEQKEKMMDYMKESVLDPDRCDGTYYKNRRGEGKYMTEAVERFLSDMEVRP